MTVNAPQAELSLMFADPSADAVVWLTNSSFDDLRPGAHEDFPLSDEEIALLPGEGGYEVPDLPNVDLIFGASGILNTTRVFIVSAEFHYRNDASRHMWGTPATVEEHITQTMEDQTKAIKLAFSYALPWIAKMGGDVAISFREYIQSDETSTDDRHVLYLYIPIDQVSHLKEGQLLEWLRKLLTNK